MVKTLTCMDLMWAENWDISFGSIRYAFFYLALLKREDKKENKFKINAIDNIVPKKLYTIPDYSEWNFASFSFLFLLYNDSTCITYYSLSSILDSVWICLMLIHHCCYDDYYCLNCSFYSCLLLVRIVSQMLPWFLPWFA